jgi:hypothetical protein
MVKTIPDSKSGIKEILEWTDKNWPDVDICAELDIARSTLARWRHIGRARSDKIQTLIRLIEEMPNNWDGGPEIDECIKS